MNTQQSPIINELAQAVIACQCQLKNPDKDKQGYGYKYADLSSILDQVKPVLEKNNLAVIQTAEHDNQSIGVTTTLIHASGQYIQSTLCLPIPDMKGTTITQAAGAAITYARRYAISAILNIAADEDTDAASKEVRPVKNNTQVSTNNASEKQIKMIYGLINRTGRDIEKAKENIKSYYKINHFGELSLSQASQIIDKLSKEVNPSN